MKIVPPHKISTEIIDIIYEAKEFVILVSPYVNLSNWDRLSIEIRNAIKRNVRIDVFVRNEPENSKSWEQLNQIGVKARLVTNLHAKFYFNEKSGLISSMNLLSSSNNNSIEIGTKLSDEKELNELKKFVKDFIIINETTVQPSKEDLYLSKEKFTVALQNFLNYNLNSPTRIFFKQGTFHINTLNNQFFLNIDKTDNLIELTAIVSEKEAEYFKVNESNYFKSNYFHVELHEGKGNSYNTIVAYSKKLLSNSFLDNLRVNEKKELIYQISEYLSTIKKLKDFSHQ
ncbi:phospholipase D-like domain-containing protein [Maribellus sediminis]|uniref:phospholipase D-like domain-containing protein n=1 Tax=Maribellus sediminis TaxID=2696285 RepID=UPI001430DFA2|nr:phospholipase D-like domain-containing protein [Maribellus sediminis]